MASAKATIKAQADKAMAKIEADLKHAKAKAAADAAKVANTYAMAAKNYPGKIDAKTRKRIAAGEIPHFAFGHPYFPKGGTAARAPAAARSSTFAPGGKIRLDILQDREAKLAAIVASRKGKSAAQLKKEGKIPQFVLRHRLQLLRQVIRERA